MKALRTIIPLFVLAFFLVSFTTAKASVAVSEEKTSEMLQQKASENEGIVAQMTSKMEKRFAKKAAKIEKKLAKRFGNGEKVDFNDPVDKWMWFWIFGWAAGFLLYSFGWFVAAPFWYLGYLCMLAGTVCLIVWLLKKSGNMD